MPGAPTNPTQTPIEVDPLQAPRGDASGDPRTDRRVENFKGSLSRFAAALDKTREALQKEASREVVRTLTVHFERLTDEVPPSRDATEEPGHGSTAPRTLTRLDGK
ncbi:hypothetical protein LY474_22060 [Myxococcus stipitatus]|uniref:hypothetical protein n=1 Tax=Myxococcus stipitatus TaxID=83455 RepID=UPI001F379898|nr:hypothetical protein [Myxococcus stipitatus]MCE9670492.1 hypothetical protein [Myxococcus stipitatus]